MASILDKAIGLIKSLEGCRLTAYLDSVGVPTIGWGSTDGIHLGMTWTQAQADSSLLDEVEKCATRINALITKPINNNQLSALVSFTYNVGLNAFYHSRLLIYLNQGLSKDVVAKEFLRWDHGGGKVIPGLTRRRRIEHDLYLS